MSQKRKGPAGAAVAALQAGPNSKKSRAGHFATSRTAVVGRKANAEKLQDHRAATPNQDSDRSAAFSMLEFPSEIPLETRSDDLIKNVIGRGDFAMLYGPSGSGKTFLALHLGFMIALGNPALGRPTGRAPVLYIGFEGIRGLRQRIRAGKAAYGDPGRHFARLKSSLSLDKTECGDEGLQSIIEASRELSAHSGEPVGLVIIDTFARAIAGDEENSSADVSAFVEHRANAISRSTGAAILIVHHDGKISDRGARGSNALPAACDVVLKVSGNGKVMLEKVRDAPDGDFARFRLVPVILGGGNEGDEVTTCTVEMVSEVEPRPAKPSAKLPEAAQIALDVLKEMCADGLSVGARQDIARPSGGEKILAGVELEQWRKRFLRTWLSKDKKTNAARMAFQRAVERLKGAGVITQSGNLGSVLNRIVVIPCLAR